MERATRWCKTVEGSLSSYKIGFRLLNQLPFPQNFPPANCYTKQCFSVLVRKAKVSRIAREFSEVTQASSQSVVETNNQVTTSSSTRLVPGMSQYDDEVDMHDYVDMVVGSEDFEAADQESAAISQRCEFFELSPR